MAKHLSPAAGAQAPAKPARGGSTTPTWAAILIAVIGSGGVGAIVSKVMSVETDRKVREAEAAKADAEAAAKRAEVDKTKAQTGLLEEQERGAKLTVESAKHDALLKLKEQELEARAKQQTLEAFLQTLPPERAKEIADVRAQLQGIAERLAEIQRALIPVGGLTESKPTSLPPGTLQKLEAESEGLRKKRVDLLQGLQRSLGKLLAERLGIGDSPVADGTGEK